jgi:hypothetical protein
VNRSSSHAVVLAIVALAVLSLLSCGGGSSRMLQSISVSPQIANGQVQYVATGTFSAPPTTVTPLPVNWCVKTSLVATAGVCGPPGNTNPGITSQGLASCGTSPLSANVTAMAPADPKLPLNSQGVPMVSGTAMLACP